MIVQHLPQIQAKVVATKHIRSHCLFAGDESGIPVIFLHGNMSAATFFEEIMVAMPAQYWCIAPDCRGYGDTEDLPIDATRGGGDLVDDLLALYETLGIQSAHLVGWSAGAGVIMQFTLEHALRVKSLCLIAPVSPFGFGGSGDIHGNPTSGDFAGSGAGTVNSVVIEQMRLKNTGLSPELAPRQILRNYFVYPGTLIDREDVLVDAILKQKLGKNRCPGDYLESSHPLRVSPGKWGPINALSPKYFNTGGLTELAKKPPILWVRGDADRIVSDQSIFDLATVLQLQASEDTDSPVVSEINPQPMVGQMREMLVRYQKNAGQYEEIVLKNVGHAPFIEKHEDFLLIFTGFLSH